MVLAATAICISLATLISGALQLRQKASADYVRSLHDQIERLQKEVEACEIARRHLEKTNGDLLRENTSLLRQLLKLPA